MPIAPLSPKPLPASVQPSRWQWRLRATGKVLLAGCATLLLLLAGFYGYLQLTNNFHEVEPGLYYRSAQLDPDELQRIIKQHGIRSVLNLRGKNTGTPWYDSEVVTAAGSGVTHLDYAISARNPVSLKQIGEIQALIAQAPKPILVHCWDGADRTGLITAIYRLSRGADVDVADQELSIRYGHFPYFGSKSRAMDDSFQAYVNNRKVLAAPAR